MSEYGESNNYEIAERHGAGDMDKWPTYVFFPANSKEGVEFAGDEQAMSAMLAFIKKQGVHVGLPGSMEEFDVLAKDFMEKKDERVNILQKAEKAMADLQDKKTSLHYVTAMKKIMKKGDNFAQGEIDRLKKMIDEESVKEEKRDEFGIRINILYSFLVEA
mmetsp:Transcript_22557/g.35286  ORF Transcript_22557/g.35286 Transcript_22557/m.35286 type:complete len:161 (-) Transcript_22557:1009-1491(-)|eukprot:CAMPEP_0184316668 /NCGR_PEP_ID=MMETSP1049-20130417/91692_1 /TAXON_ID=77928 /ORGANISM="Proteomonas sulcata, Strain CCMP704" /LENGTH=160 /DNA_ID=CAMNT_0026635747 /DNA_START=820 /DNA_END=1302 /DNA_ORIENTATION=+